MKTEVRREPCPDHRKWKDFRTWHADRELLTRECPLRLGQSYRIVCHTSALSYHRDIKEALRHKKHSQSEKSSRLAQIRFQVFVIHHLHIGKRVSRYNCSISQYISPALHGMRWVCPDSGTWIYKTFERDAVMENQSIPNYLCRHSFDWSNCPIFHFCPSIEFDFLGGKEMNRFVNACNHYRWCCCCVLCLRRNHRRILQ